MRVLHLEASAGWGGQEMRILSEMKGMRALGHEMLLGVMNGGKLGEKARTEGFSVWEVDFRKRKWISCLTRLLLLIRSQRIELVNTHSSLDSWIGGIAARLARVPIVRTRHLSAPIKPGWNSRLLYGTLADFVVTTCSSILSAISEQSGKSLVRCRMVATGVDPQKVRFAAAEAREFRQRMGVAPSDFLVGTACFMRSWKGIADFLKAADALRHVKDLRWIIIGGGHEETYRDLARELSLGGIVHFTGHLENPFPALGALDLFALLSTRNEAISQALLQAAFLGKPLVATTVGGSNEICLDRVTGLQVPPHSPAEVARAVMELKGAPSLRTQLGERGRQLVETRFTRQHMIDAMCNIYESVLY